MTVFKLFFGALTKKERLVFIIAGAILVLASTTRFALAFQESSEWVPVRGGSYREGMVGQPVAVNPVISENQADQDISRLIYSSLYDITESFETEDEGRTYVLKLKEGLLWSNGQPLTSDDVIFTIETIQNPDARSPYATSWEGVVAERLSEVRVSLALPAPYTYFTENLKNLFIIPVHIFGSIPAANLRLSAYNLEPVSSGPYKFQSFTKRKDGFISAYNLETNENYQDEKPFLKEFHFIFYENQEALLKDFKLRRVDSVGSLTPINPEALPSSASISLVPMPSYYAIFFNENLKPILKDADFREVLDVGLNKRRIIEEALGNGAEAVNGPLGRLGNAPETSYNPEEAKEYIESLGEENIELTIITPDIEFLKKTAEMIRDDWTAIGIDKVNVITPPAAEFIEGVVKTNNYEMILFGNVLEHPLDLFPFWHSSKRFSPGLNLSLYKNSEVDTLIEKVRQAEGEEEQKELAGAAEEIIVNERPAIFLYSIPYTYVHDSDLKGFGFSDKSEFIVTPSDRFKNINKWHVSEVRIIR
ncbi:MAG: ABC transporter substrate-binding protein [Candidatus Jorgensenbacteria bacterium]